MRIDLNVDMGESFGRWELGDDAGLMPLVSSANVACGFHAGDATVMRRTCALAVAHGVAVGAHVGLPDLLGFGRRRMAVAPEEVRDQATYQIGALRAIAHAEGAELRHVKAHGALYAMCSEDRELAGALAAAVADVDAGLRLLLLTRAVEPAVAAHGVRLAPEAFPDLGYQPDGTLVIEAVKRACDPGVVAARAVRVVREGRIDAVDGTSIAVDAETLCLHGDAPNAVEVARAVRAELERAGVEVRALGHPARDSPRNPARDSAAT